MNVFECQADQSIVIGSGVTVRIVSVERNCVVLEIDGELKTLELNTPLVHVSSAALSPV